MPENNASVDAFADFDGEDLDLLMRIISTVEVIESYGPDSQNFRAGTARRDLREQLADAKRYGLARVPYVLEVAINYRMQPVIGVYD